MPLQISPLVLYMLVSGIVSALLTVVAWQNRSIPIIRPFLFLMVAETVWIFGDLIQMMVQSLPFVLLINIVEYLGIMTVPIAWLFLVLVYTGRGHYLTRRTVPLFFIIPGIVWLMVLTNPLHYLYYTSISPQLIDGVTIWIYKHGPLFWLHITYCYLLGLTALILAAGRLFGPTELYRRQTLLLAVAACFPIIFNMAYVFRIMPFPEYDLTPIAFLASSLLIAIGILRYQLFSAVPVAYSRVFFMSGDGVFVADAQNRVLDLNPAAERIAGIRSCDAIGQPVGQVVPELAGSAEALIRDVPCRFEIRREREGAFRYFDVLVTPMDEKIEVSGGYICLLRDITARKIAELALAEANRKIGLLTSITRHDITNKIVAVHSYLELSRDLATNPQQIEYLAKQEQALAAISEQIAFTHEYQQLGTEAPAWQDLGTLVLSVRKEVDLGSVVLENTAGPWEILADPMLGKVFSNLCDNAVKYGGNRLTGIRISSRQAGNELEIMVEDDGAGIAPEDRAHLFERGYGKHTGLGLFLSREILAITGIAIRETSEPGQGARFEIRVPTGKFRTTGDRKS